jgi:hypothetical protein
MGKPKPGYRNLLILAILAFLFCGLRFANLAGSPFFAFAAAGALLVLVTRPLRFSGAVVAIALACGLAAAYRASGGTFGAFPGAAFESALAFLGLAACVVLAWSAVRHEDALKDFLTASTLAVFAAITVIALRFFLTLQLPVYDLHLYAFDSRLGFEASSIVARWFDEFPLLRPVCAAGYQALPLIQVAVLTIYLRRDRKFPIFPVLVFGLAGLEAPVLYRILPAVGPVHVFGPQFAYRVHEITGMAATLPTDATPPNSMPSLHFAWALLILWNMPRQNRAAVVGAAAFLGLITLATLGLGEHYLVDLIVAVPFAVAVQNTCTGRWISAATAGAIVLAWLGYLRSPMPYAEPRFAAAWTAALVTVSVPFFFTVRRDTEVAEELPARSDELAYSGPSI